MIRQHRDSMSTRSLLGKARPGTVYQDSSSGKTPTGARHATRYGGGY